MLTLASGPVSAAPGCMVASSFISVATFNSRNPSGIVGCTTQDAAYWSGKAKAGYVSGGTYGGTCSNPSLNVTVGTALGNAGGCSYNGYNICYVMQNIASSGSLAVLQRILAVWLDLTVSPVNIVSSNNMSAAYIKTMWMTYSPAGAYVVGSTGVTWHEADILKYLNAMLGAAYPFS